MGTKQQGWLAAVSGAACFTLLACADSGASVPAGQLNPGVATVGFTSVPLTAPELSLSAATLRLSHIAVLGNATPPPPMGGPPPLPGPRPGPSTSLVLDVLSPATASVSLDDLPQGLYSRVEFFVGDVSLAGLWRGTSLRAELVMVMHKRVDLRTGTPRELGPDLNAPFSVSLDPNLWFAGLLLNGATVTNGQIVCDAQRNPEIAAELTNRIARSFVMP